MAKSLGPILIGFVALVLLLVSMTFRMMPQIAEQWMRSEFKKTFVTKDIEWIFPFGVRIQEISILDGDEERAEVVFQAKEILTYWNWKELLDKDKKNPSRLHVVSPKMIIRKRGDRYIHFLSAPESGEQGDQVQSLLDPVADKWFPDKLLVSNGMIKFEDFTAGTSGYSTTFSKVWLRYQDLSLSKGPQRSFALEYESYWDQLRDEIPGEIFISFANYSDHTPDLDLKVRFDRVDIRSLKVYLKKYISTIPADGIMSGILNGSGNWEDLQVHSELTFNRLSFPDSSDPDNEVFGMDPVILREVLRNKEGLAQVNPSFSVNFMKSLDFNTQNFFNELSKSMRSNFMMNLDKVVLDAMNDIRPDRDVMISRWEDMITSKEKGFIAKTVDKLQEYFKPEDTIRD